jgi:putative endonuclease
MAFYVYILASQRNGTLYIGHTDDLNRRVIEHKARAWPSFTEKYDVTQLVWFEAYETREEAFAKERRMKTWKRVWKLELIERKNPTWRDLFGDFQDGQLGDSWTELGPGFRQDERS